MKLTFEEVEELRQELGLTPDATEEDWVNMLHKRALNTDEYWERNPSVYTLLKGTLRSEVKKMLETIKEGKSVVTHDLEISPRFFGDIVSGEKRCEIRRNDRDYRVGDLLLLREYDQKGGGRYTGQSVLVRVTHIVHESSISEFNLLAPGCVVMSICLVEK